MGNVSFGAPRNIIEKIRTSFNVNTFVETGTYMGGTAAWASEHFDQVFTIEGSADYHRQAQERLTGKRNIEFLLGDSRRMLGEVVSRLGDKPALFWLDAHWMPGSFGETHECPLLEEITAIQQSGTEHFLLIDDARLFLAPPPLPHRARDWPDITAVLSSLNTSACSTTYTVIYNDVIVSLPSFTRKTMESFYQEHITASFQAASESPVHPMLRTVRGLKRRLRKALGRN
jgi:hypothetical protein